MNTLLLVLIIPVGEKISIQQLKMQKLEFCINIAKTYCIRSIRLDVYQKKQPAIHLYQKIGFEYIDKVDLGLSEFGLGYFQLYELVI